MLSINAEKAGPWQPEPKNFKGSVPSLERDVNAKVSRKAMSAFV